MSRMGVKKRCDGRGVPRGGVDTDLKNMFSMRKRRMGEACPATSLLPLPATLPPGRMISLKESSRRVASLDSWRRLIDVEVVEAVRGNDIEADDPRVSMSLYRRLLLHSPSSRWNPALFFTNRYLAWNKAQIGCALSHIAAWTEVATSKIAMIIIEDDVIVSDSVTKEDLAVAIRGSGLVSLMHTGGNHMALEEMRSKSSVRHFWGAQAYYVTPAAAVQLLAFAYPVDIHIDRYMAVVAHRVHADWRVCNPSLKFRCSGKSQLNHDTPRQLSIILIAGACILLVACLSVAMTLKWKRCTGSLSRCSAYDPTTKRRPGL